jgi:hypothetical protein
LQGVEVKRSIFLGIVCVLAAATALYWARQRKEDGILLGAATRQSAETVPPRSGPTAKAKGVSRGFVTLSAPLRDGGDDLQTVKRIGKPAQEAMRAQLTAPEARDKRLNRLPGREDLQSRVEEAAMIDLGLADSQKENLRSIRADYYRRRRALFEDSAHAVADSWGNDRRVAELQDQVDEAIKEALGGTEPYGAFRLAEVEAQRRMVRRKAREESRRGPSEQQ